MAVLLKFMVAAFHTFCIMYEILFIKFISRLPNCHLQKKTFIIQLLSGIRFEFRLQQASGLLMFAASASQNEYIAVLFKNGRPRFMYDTQGGCILNMFLS